VPDRGTPGYPTSSGDTATAAFRGAAGVREDVGAPRYDLRTGRPDLSTFPRTAWAAAVTRALRTLPDAALGYGDPRGLPVLRETLAQYLGRVRGVVADPADIVVSGGIYEGLGLLWRALAERGVTRVAVEDPGWHGQRRGVEHAGLEAVPVPVDDRGLVVDALPGDVGAVVVTPAHQFPLGVVLAPERRTALLDWARRHDALVVEDDYDAEYRYDREPVGALQGLAADRVVFAGSASKTLAPGMRLGWMLAPSWLAPDLAHHKDLLNRGTPVLEQAALNDLLDRGEVDRHLRRNRRLYRARRDTLVAALGEHWPELELGGAAAGLHLVAWLPEGIDERAALDAAAGSGVAVHALHAHCTCVRAMPPALLLGYAAAPEATLTRAARELVSAVRACAASRTPATA
jgi:GntR family transcriptional regulator/MocR family aminotransferase